MASLLIDVAARPDLDHFDDDVIFIEDDPPIADSQSVGILSLQLLDVVGLRGGIVGILAKFRSDAGGLVSWQFRKRLNRLFAVGYFLAHLVA